MLHYDSADRGTNILGINCNLGNVGIRGQPQVAAQSSSKRMRTVHEINARALCSFLSVLNSNILIIYN